VNSSLAGAKLNYFFDFDANGVFGNTPAEIFSATLSAGSQQLVIDVPANAVPVASVARFRLSTAGGLGPTGLAADGEVEDYSITIYSSLPALDYGDAPNSYGTSAATGGPRHVVAGGLWLGAGVDAENVGQPNSTSTGDGADDNGVKFPQILIPGTNANINVTSSGSGTLNYFFDFDGSGVFGDQPNESFQGVLNPGTTVIVVPVPASAFVGQIAARFRLSTAGTATAYGFAPDGEVEDYQVRTVAINVCTPLQNFDSVVAPALPAGWTRTSVPVGGLPVNWITRNAASDSPLNHAFVPSAGYVSTNSLTSAPFTVNSFNQRIRFQHSYELETYWDGARMEISVNGNPFVDIVSAGGIFVAGGYHSTINTISNNPIGGTVAWTGNSSDFYESIVTLPGNTLGQSVRLRWSEATDDSTAEVGWKLDSIQGCRVALAFDYGDAPGLYPTTSSVFGAAHATQDSLRLGTLFDTETNGAPHPNAAGDDGATSADEDGVTFVSSITQGSTALVTAVASGNALFQGWIDFNDDGDWNDAGEQVFADVPVTTGANNLAFQVPAGAVVTPQTFARFRLSTQAGLLATGQAPDGEVEDYQLAIQLGNPTPTINPIADRVVDEDAGPQVVNFTGITAGGSDSQAITVTATSNNPTLIPNPPVTYTSAGQAGSLTFTPTANLSGSAVITVTVRDAGVDGTINNADDGFVNSSFTVTVNNVNDPPAFVKGGDQFVQLNAGPQTVVAWANNITPGAPNEAAQTVSFAVTNNSNSAIFSAQPAISPDGTLTYTPATGAAGTATITIVAQDSAGGVSAPQTFVIAINGLLTFQVLTFAPTTTGATLQFNRDFDVAPLNLYDTQGGGIGPADIVLQGATVGPVRGSLHIDAAARRLTFIATTGILAPDDYTLTVRSAADGLRDTNGELMDGDANGTAGGNFIQNFTVTAPAANAVTLSIPNIARGPQQSVNLPTPGAPGIPITLSNGDGVTSASFQLRYNPALLNITSAAVSAGMPAGSSVNFTFPSSGLMNVQFSSPTPLAAGAAPIVNLLASVPSDAPYQSKQLLDLSNVSINSGAIPGIEDDAIQVVAYFGDVSASGTYTAQDAARLSRVVIGLDSGFETYQLLDPVIVADVNGSGTLTSADTSRVLQLGVGTAVPEVPPQPSPAVSLIFGGPDPKLSISTDLRAAPGESVIIPVQIDSIVDLTGDGLESADLVMYYDASVLDIESVSLGSLFAGRESNWFVGSRIDVLAGRIIVSLAGSKALEGRFVGELVQLHGHVKADAAVGSSAINLAASSRDPSRFTQLNEGYLTLIPAPTDAPNDVGVDGRLTVVGSAASQVATASVVNDQLLVNGTDANDQIFASLLSNGLIRVRAGQTLLGDFAAPGGIAIAGGAGSDYIVADPGLRATISTVVKPFGGVEEDDFIFAGAAAQVVDADALGLQPLPAGGQVASDMALLEILASWGGEDSGTPTSNSIRRRR
jgi:hypothetical protein